MLEFSAKAGLVCEGQDLVEETLDPETLDEVPGIMSLRVLTLPSSWTSRECRGTLPSSSNC